MTAEPTNTELAILGLVAEGPRHGYQIEQDIEQRGMRNWTEIGFSSIYYILNKLEKAGWLVSALSELALSVEPPEALDTQPAPRAGGPARRVYQVTGEGRAALREAVRRRLAEPRPRSGDFELALANLPVLAPEEARAALEIQRSALRTRLERLIDKWAADQAAAPGDLPPHVNALFDHSLAMIRAELKWLNRYLDGE